MLLTKLIPQTPDSYTVSKIPTIPNGKQFLRRDNIKIIGRCPRFNSKQAYITAYEDSNGDLWASIEHINYQLATANTPCNQHKSPSR